MPGKATRLAEWLRQRAPTRVELRDFDELLRLLAPIAESDLRRLLRESGAPLDALTAGVDQSSFPALRDSLLVLAEHYELGSAESARLCRRIVITAKDHAKLAARNPRLSPGKRDAKSEMAAWMLTWLENPAIFPVWVRLREKSLQLDGFHL